MSFFEGDQGEPKKLSSMFDNFIKISPDYQTVIQVLEPKVTKEKNVIWKHYIPQALRKSGKRGMPIVCPGISICPICQRNAKLGDNKHPEYISPQKRFVVNVLDLTPAKVCSLCNTENYGDACSYCGFNLSEIDATPVNKVRILERGVTLFQQLDALEKTVKIPYDPNDPLMNDPADNKYMDAKKGTLVVAGITRFPITLASSKDNKGNLLITPIPGPVNNLNWRDYEKFYCDPKAMYFILTPPEIKELMEGGSLSEILKARRGSDESTPNDIPF